MEIYAIVNSTTEVVNPTFVDYICFQIKDHKHEVELATPINKIVNLGIVNLWHYDNSGRAHCVYTIEDIAKFDDAALRIGDKLIPLRNITLFTKDEYIWNITQIDVEKHFMVDNKIETWLCDEYQGEIKCTTLYGTNSIPESHTKIGPIYMKKSKIAKSA